MLKRIICSLLVFLPFILEAHDKFVVLTPPKCGTHLIVKALDGLVEKEATRWLGDLPENAQFLTVKITRGGGYVVCHNWNYDTLDSLIKRGYKVIFILRDPRDHLVSVLDWSFCPNWGGPKHILQIKDREERLRELIVGERGWRCYEFIESRLKLLSSLPSKYCFTVRFENLVGPQGGGSEEEQLKELNALANFINADVSQEKIEEVAENLWGNSPTFHIGMIGRWRYDMTPEQIELYHSIYRKKLRKLGYH